MAALSKLVLGDQEALERVRSSPVVTIDGCKQMCAAKLVKQAGGKAAQEVAVFEQFQNYRGLKPEGIAELNGEGKQLAHILAEEIAEQFDALQSPGAVKGSQHA